MAVVPFRLDALNGGEGAAVHDIAFGRGPQYNQGSVSGTVTFDPTATLEADTPGVGTILCSPTGALTGAIIVAALRERQQVLIVNEHASNTITFATAATSNVLGGASVVLPAASAVLFVWDSNNSRWCPVVSANLNVAGVTATAAEINVLHSVTAGTAAASSAAVLGASKDLDTLQLDQSLVLAKAASVAYGATMALVVATPRITIAANHTTSGTYTLNCAAVAPDGAQLHITVTEGAGTGTAVGTFGTHFKSTGTLTTASSGTSTIAFEGDGTNWNELSRAATLS